VNTQEILDLALSMAGLKEAPADTGIHVPSQQVKKAMFGVDIDTADLLLARELGCDAVIAHHPGATTSGANMYKVMERSIELMVREGVPINKAQKALKERQDTVGRAEHSGNWDKVTSAAKLLKMTFMNIHMPIDIVSERTVQKHLDSRLNPKSKLSDVIDALKEMPEFAGEPAGPVIRAGDKDSYAGRVMVSMATGTNCGPNVMKAYYEAGVGTLVMMHIPEDSLKAIKEQNYGNVIIAGHMRSDSVGLNLFVKELEARGIEVIKMSGIVG
jgi:putative NIF3 family GTP cyclohydrolase 1 type 2